MILDGLKRFWNLQEMLFCQHLTGIAAKTLITNKSLLRNFGSGSGSGCYFAGLPVEHSAKVVQYSKCQHLVTIQEHRIMRSN